uniref:Uncharacterized protein n=1 Tax=Stomoxys calcitrans TaxID=35570 RepID=A0A1I8NUR9_STOCA
MDTDNQIQNTSPTCYRDNNEQAYFKIENITVIKPPLLKVYYWQSLDIEGLNRKLLSDAHHIQHNFYLPTNHLHSNPQKIVFWLRNLSKNPVKLNLKRLQNCQCVPLQTRVGFNQFRSLYHCPHRRLINITQEIYQLDENDLVALTMVAYFYLYGSFVLSYEMSCSNSRIIILNFHVDIFNFEPLKSILTTELIPVNIKEYRSMSQAIWVRNITAKDLKFRFITSNRGLCLINSHMIIPRQSVWPLIVDYRPSDFTNELTLTLLFDGLRFDTPLTCKGILGEEYITSQSEAPLEDYECADMLHVVIPNKLQFNLELNDLRSLMVLVHNHNQKCMEFKWQTYSILDYFTFTFEPSQFTLKPHHSKLCVVHCKSYSKPLDFRYIPAVLEIHRILDKSTKIAQELLTEIESIDDPKWREGSYVEHVFLQIDLKVNFAKLDVFEVRGIEEKTKSSPMIIPMSHDDASTSMENVQHSESTIFEELFWDYLSRSSSFMRNTQMIARNLTYEEVIRAKQHSKSKEKPTKNEGLGICNIINYIVAESCRDLSKNYRFVPAELLETP